MTRELCILVHGFTGSPDELAPLATALRHLGYEVQIPMLPGHGGTKMDLEQATASAWMQSIEPMVQAGLARGRVHLIGFSMGAMLSAVLASKWPVASLTMLSPAVFYVGTSQVFRQIATVIKETWKDGQFQQSYVKQRIAKMSQTPLRSIKQFRRMVNMGKSALPNVNVPVCVIQGEKDEVVEPRGATYAYNTVATDDKQIHFLHESSHLVCYGPEADRLNKVVIAFLSDHREKQTPQDGIHA
jgi:carboxylesterase